MSSHIQTYRATLRVLMFLGSASFLSGCTWLLYDRYETYTDDFRNTTKSIARMELRPLERRTEIGNAHLIFERDRSIRFDNYKIYCVIARLPSSFNPDEVGYMKIDDTNYEINIGNLISEQKMKTETSSEAYTRIDSTSVTTGTATDTDTRLWIDDKFNFIPTQQMIDDIKSSNTVIIRFYFGPIPATYRINGNNLKFLKKAFSGQNI